jgi:hypothetical protein
LEQQRAEFAVFIVWDHLGWWWQIGSILGVRALPVFVTHSFREAMIIANTTYHSLKSSKSRLLMTCSVFQALTRYVKFIKRTNKCISVLWM